MGKSLTDEELAARCHCGVPIDQADGHRRPCPVAERAYNAARTTGRDQERVRAAADVARALAAGRAYLLRGGRPFE